MPGGGTVEVCNGIDDDCNGIIDNNPIDAGGACGTVVVDPTIKQNPLCALGKYVCRLPESQGGVPGQSNNAAGDQIFCDGQVTGTSEICNGIDDNCNGVVDENVPGQGGDCAPDGLTLPLLGECRPGHLYCLDGKMKCVGGVGPQPELCDGKDHNCDGKIDTGSCTDPNSRCIRGACRPPCAGTEFRECPGGTVCAAGFCVPPDCAGQCAAGETCNATMGQCESSDGGVVSNRDGGSGGAPGTAGDSGAGASGASGSDAELASTGGALGGAGTAGTNGNTVDNSRRDAFGLATGGGGCACTMIPTTRSNSAIGFGSILALSILGRRSRRRAGARGRS